jgi:polyketide synthase 12
MTAGLTRADWERMARQGFRPLSARDGLALLDRCLDADRALAVATRLDLSRPARDANGPAPLLSRLVRRAASRRSAGGGAQSQQGLAARLAALGADEQHQVLLEILRAQTALVLGITAPQGIDAHRSFRDLGFDSLTAVELRNRLNAATGLQFPATMIFDYPTPDHLAGRMAAELGGAPRGGEDKETLVVTAFADLERIEAGLDGILADEAVRSRLEARLRGLLTALGAAGVGAIGGIGGEANGAGLVDTIQAASDDDMFDFIDNQLGI